MQNELFLEYCKGYYRQLLDYKHQYNKVYITQKKQVVLVLITLCTDKQIVNFLAGIHKPYITYSTLIPIKIFFIIL